MGADAVEKCALCGSAAAPFHRVRNRSMCRDFVHCRVCDLVSVPRRFHVGHEAERERYLEHDNDPNDPDYRAFLARLWDNLRLRVEPGSKGLDYGAGPGPALAAMMEEDGFEVSIYDKHFHPDKTALAKLLRLHRVHGDGGAFRQTSIRLRGARQTPQAVGVAGNHDGDAGRLGGLPRVALSPGPDPRGLLHQPHHAVDRREARLAADVSTPERRAVPQDMRRRLRSHASLFPP